MPEVIRRKRTPPYRSLRSPRAALSVSSAMFAVLVLLTVSGCVDGSGDTEPPEFSTPVPTRTPVFASDEEAVAAAEAALERYRLIDDSITNEGGVDPGRIEAVAAPELAAHHIENAEELRAAGQRYTGETVFSNVKLQQWRTDSDWNTTVVLYACVDVTARRTIAADGSDVTSTSRTPRVTLEIAFTSISPKSTELIVERSELWPNGTRCG